MKKTFLARKFLFLTQAFLFASLLISCSLNYGEQVKAEGVVPEFVFNNARFSRYENKKKTMELDAESLEQYKSDSASFAKNATFKTWNKEGNLDTEGKCVLLGLNTNDKIYTMFNDIILKNIDQELEIHAQNLKWDGKTEQLVSGKNDIVRIKRGSLELEGKGFSASGVSKSFSFSQKVQGTIIEKEKSAEEENSSEGEEQ